MAITGSEKAYQYALSGVMRSGASRSNYTSGYIFISLDGKQIANHPDAGIVIRGVELDSLRITDELDETPSRCTFRTIGGTAFVGAPVSITMGSTNNGTKLFAGFVMDTSYSYWARSDRNQNYFSDVSCLDYTWLFSFVKVTKQYTNSSATTIATDLVATYAAANGFTANSVTPDLPPLDEITFTNEDLGDAMTRLARRIGAYWYVDYDKDVHLFFAEESASAPRALTPSHPSLDDLVKLTDRTQVLSRVYIEGRGTTVLTDIGVGDTTIPVEAVDMFTVAPDIFLKVAHQGADGGAQHLNFSGVVAGEGGTIIGPGIGPASPVTLTAQAGAGVDSGTHSYATTFGTASGESLASPTATVTTGQVTNPSVQPGPVTQTPTHDYHGSFIPIGHTVLFAYTYSTQVSSGSLPTSPQTQLSPASASLVTISNQDAANPSMSAPVTIPVPYATDARVQWVIVWARDPATTGATFVLFANAIPNVTGGGTLFVTSEGSSINPGNPVAPASNTSGSNQVSISAIPVGAAAVTHRKVYRTEAGAAQLKLLTTIANNTATTYLDVLADASLGANIPVTDTSGLAQPAGQVLPGAPSIPVAGSGAFQTAGGWAIIGNGEQVIRYTGVTASTLTGIPASGSGSITAAVNYNSTITAAPLLTGIPASGPRSIARPLTKGDEVYLVVQVDDAARQTAIAADMGGPGIREEWDQDRRLSITEARARGRALLGLRVLDHYALTYRCRDLNTAAGQTVILDIPQFGSQGFRIQRVTIDNFRPYPTQYPTYTVEASITRFSFEDLLRSARTKE